MKLWGPLTLKLKFLVWLSRPFLIVMWSSSVSSNGHPWVSFPGTCYFAKTLLFVVPQIDVPIWFRIVSAAYNISLLLLLKKKKKSSTASAKSPSPTGFKDFSNSDIVALVFLCYIFARRIDCLVFLLNYPQMQQNSLLCNTNNTFEDLGLHF